MNNKSEPPHSSLDFKLERRITELVNEYDSREIASTVSNLSISQLKRYMAGSSEPGLKPIGKLAEKKNISLDWVWDGKSSKYKKLDTIHSDIYLIIEQFNRYKNTIAFGEPRSKSINSFVDDYNKESSGIKKIPTIPHITDDKLNSWLNNSNTVQEGNVNYAPEVNVETLKSATELMLKTSKGIEYDPPAVWSALIIELILAHGLTANGSRRILETLAEIEKRNNENKD